MKIDIAEVPNIRNLLDQLDADRKRLAFAASLPEESSFCLANADGGRMTKLSRAEVVQVLQARVDAGLKTLNMRYYIEFKNLDGSQPLPLVRPQVDVTNADGPAAADAATDA